MSVDCDGSKVMWGNSDPIKLSHAMFANSIIGVVLIHVCTGIYVWIYTYTIF